MPTQTLEFVMTFKPSQKTTLILHHPSQRWLCLLPHQCGLGGGSAATRGRAAPWEQAAGD